MKELIKREIAGFICLAVVIAFVASSCSKDTAAKAQKIENKVKQGISTGDKVLTVVDSLVKAVAPGSTAAKTLDTASVIAQKVDGAVQKVSITVPVTPEAEMSDTTPGAGVQHDVKDGVKIAADSVQAIDSIVKSVAPNSTAAKTTDKISVAAQKVDGVVQAVTIVVPVSEDTAPPPAN